MSTAAAGRPEVLRDVVFAEHVGYRPLTLDLHLPSVPAAPVIVFVHGGGFRLGSRRMFCPTMTELDPFACLVDAGFAVASIDYRLSAEAPFPAQVDDVAAAVAWVRRNAERFGLDPERIVLWGESAGGTLAALTGLDAGIPVRGVVDWYGPAAIIEMATALGELDERDSREAGWLGHPVSADLDRARAASPVQQVSAAAPPFHIAHGLDDTAVPPAQSEMLARALERAGADVALALVPGAGHMWRGDAVDRDGLLADALVFCRRVTA